MVVDDGQARDVDELLARGIAKIVKNFTSDMKGEGRFAPMASNSANPSWCFEVMTM